MQSRLVGRKTTVVVGGFFFSSVFLSFLNHNSDGFLWKKKKNITTLLSKRCLEEYKISAGHDNTWDLFIQITRNNIRRWSSLDCFMLEIKIVQIAYINRCLNISLGITYKLVGKGKMSIKFFHKWYFIYSWHNFWLLWDNLKFFNE